MRRSFIRSFVLVLACARVALAAEPQREKADFTILRADAAARTAECSDFRFDVSRELRLLDAQPQAIDVAAGGEGVTKITEGQAYDVKLEPQNQARFVAKPEKPTTDEGSFAGVVQVVPSKDGNLRVSLSEAAWIDVLAGGKPLTSTSHSGSHNCKVLRKGRAIRCEEVAAARTAIDRQPVEHAQIARDAVSTPCSAVSD